MAAGSVADWCRRLNASVADTDERVSIASSKEPAAMWFHLMLNSLDVISARSISTPMVRNRYPSLLGMFCSMAPETVWQWVLIRSKRV